MPTYIVLANFTEQGVRNFRDSPQRADAAAAFMEGLGGRMVDIHWTVGLYDLVVVVEAPDDETVSAMMLGIASQGNVRTTTMRAFSREEFTRVAERAG